MTKSQIRQYKFLKTICREPGCARKRAGRRCVSVCKVHRSEYQISQYRKHRTKKLEYQREYYKKNREHLRAYKRDWYKAAK